MNIIVIPAYKNSHLIQQLLNGLRRHEKDNIGEIFIVNDSPGDPDLDGCLDFWVESKLLPITAVNNKINSGFTISSNIGLRHACAQADNLDTIFLLSTDIKVTGQFLESARQTMLSQMCLLGHRLLSHDTGWNTFNGVTFPYLEGYFLAATAEVWKELDYFDEKYSPYDFEDVDLSTAALSKNYKLIPTNDPAIQHMGAQSIGYNDERVKITNRNREYFFEKWL